MTDDFSGLGLSSKVTEAVAAAGYTRPTEIQSQAIPHLLEKKDLIGIAQTGTGKTASFVLPMLTLLENGRARARMPRTLILEPTRELAAQVSENFEKYGKNHRLTMALIIGGVSFEDQNKKLDRGVDVLIATPGRLLDQIERGKIMLNGVEILVIDEADRMLDMGFIDDIEKICSRLPPRRQTMLFSATMDPQIERLTKKFLTNPVHVQVSRTASTADTIDQKLVKVSSRPDQKRAMLRARVDAAVGLTNAIIFCNRKRDVATLARSLERHGYSAGGLHGDMDQKSRTETLDAFKGGNLTLLVASDVAARGLDIPAVSHVFNFDVPVHAEDYVHRIGRTGRAGRAGTAYTFVGPGDEKHLDAILKLIQKPIDWLDVAPVASSQDSDEEVSAKPKSSRPARRRPASTRTAEVEAEDDTVDAVAEKAPSRNSRRRPASTQTAEQDVEAEAEVASAAAEKAPSRNSRRRPASTRTAEQDVEAQAEDASVATEKEPSRNSRRRPKDVPAQISDSVPGSPFGDAGPIPAFLLRATRNPEPETE